MVSPVPAIALLMVILLLPAQPGIAQDLRGPVVGELSVQPAGSSAEIMLSIENIAVVRLEGDPRLVDAIELELVVPSIVADFAGAIMFYVFSDTARQDIVVSAQEISEISGYVVFADPILRAGKSFYYIPIREDADADGSAAIKVAPTPITPNRLPLAVSLVPVMKGLTQEVAVAEFGLVARSVTRDIGLVRVEYQYEDGSTYAPDSLLSPEFSLYIDDDPTPISGEYLIPPGLHSVRLESIKFEDRSITIGIDAGSTTDLILPLVLSLATVNFTAPRGASVFVDGEAVDQESGVFTLPPGEHTIIVVVEDYTVTRRFSVEERKTYTISLTMDIEVEEAK